ncbi:hypothetical protein P4H71_08950 [Paenibacillus kribbensis]|uniref:hypothetical protein n=1 Tax=Paenibacillus kribbensis TaxID=172713 RepID=UPI002DBC2D7A|nr:hypothetical protein [Paenibacillus kribbensis]MEC0234452.1 hypothetical protein [Paenibacillus kribbensis]
MPYVKRENVAQPNFLASADYTAFTYQVEATGVTADAKGRKIVKAGTVYPANDSTAIGLLLNDVDVSTGPQPGSVLVEAWVLEARLPVPPAAEAKTAMKGIKFKKVV